MHLQEEFFGGKTVSFVYHGYSLPKHDFFEQEDEMYHLLLESISLSPIHKGQKLSCKSQKHKANIIVYLVVTRLGGPINHNILIGVLRVFYVQLLGDGCLHQPPS